MGSAKSSMTATVRVERREEGGREEGKDGDLGDHAVRVADE